MEETTNTNENGNCANRVLAHRTFIFEGYYAGEKFNIKVKANDRETAIAYFETDFPNYRWRVTTEVS